MLSDLERNTVLLTTEVSCKFLAEVRPFDEVLIRMRLIELGIHSVSIRFDYVRPRSVDEERVSWEEQTVTCMRQSGSQFGPQPFPLAMRAAFEKFWIGMGGHPARDRISH